MATIAIWMEVEEALIEAGIERGKWAEYANKATLKELEIGQGQKGEGKK